MRFFSLQNTKEDILKNVQTVVGGHYFHSIFFPFKLNSFDCELLAFVESVICIDHIMVASFAITVTVPR